MYAYFKGVTAGDGDGDGAVDGDGDTDTPTQDAEELMLHTAGPNTAAYPPRVPEFAVAAPKPSDSRSRTSASLLYIDDAVADATHSGTARLATSDAVSARRHTVSSSMSVAVCGMEYSVPSAANTTG